MEGHFKYSGIESFTLKNSIIQKCLVAQRGGAINIENNINTTENVNSSIRIENTLLARNNANDAGGAIAIKNQIANNIMNMQIINCTIWKNHVKNQGGAALLYPHGTRRQCYQYYKLHHYRKYSCRKPGIRLRNLLLERE